MTNHFRRCVLGILAIVASLMTPGVPVSAQEAAVATPGLVRKDKVPVSNEILRIKLPKPEEADLPNGLHLIVLEDHRRPEV